VRVLLQEQVVIDTDDGTRRGDSARRSPRGRAIGSGGGRSAAQACRRRSTGIVCPVPLGGSSCRSRATVPPPLPTQAPKGCCVKRPPSPIPTASGVFSGSPRHRRHGPDPPAGGATPPAIPAREPWFRRRACSLGAPRAARRRSVAPARASGTLAPASRPLVAPAVPGARNAASLDMISPFVWSGDGWEREAPSP